MNMDLNGINVCERKKGREVEEGLKIKPLYVLKKMTQDTLKNKPSNYHPSDV